MQHGIIILALASTLSLTDAQTCTPTTVCDPAKPVYVCTTSMAFCFLAASPTVNNCDYYCNWYTSSGRYSASDAAALCEKNPYCKLGGTSGSTGDPHMWKLGAHLFDFKGRNGTWYNFLSTSNLTVNVLFLHDDFFWRRKLVHGSWVKEIAVTAITATNETVKAHYSADQRSYMDVQLAVDEAMHPVPDSAGPLTVANVAALGNIQLGLTRKHVFTFSNGEWAVEAKNLYLPYRFKNGQKKRLDVQLKLLSKETSPVAPHGLMGQTYDRDDVEVIGAKDDYNVPAKVITTKAMGEGAIEGVAEDYEIDSSNPFGTAFKFSRFGLTHAPPRNVSSLKGKVVAQDKSAEKSAGAVNDEPDA